MSEQLFNIAPPPEKTYPNHDVAESALHAWTKSNGFNVSRRRIRKNDNGDICIRNYECDRAGKPKCTQKLAAEDRVRIKRGSKRCGCPMRISLRAINKNEPAGEWAIVHTGNGSAVHNHKPSMDARVHAAHRSRAAQDIIATSERSVHSIIEAQSAAGVPVANIYATMLNQDPNTLIVPKDIANAKNSARRRVLASATPIEALFNQLNQDKFFYRYTTHLETQRLKYLLWAHPATASLYKVNSDILVMDCTYKTNKFDLPLLNVISLTGMDTVIPVCQAWLPGEKKQDYTWALNMLRLLMLEYDVPEPRIISHDRDQALMNALALVFPDVPTILCRWHMNKNVLSKVREVLGKVAVENPAPGQSKYSNSLATDKFMSLFYRTVDSETEEDLRSNKAALAESNAQLAAYLSEHWWKYEDKIVKVRTNRFMHFGVRDTSTVEGTHAQCKRWIKSTRGDLFTVYNKLLPWWISSASRTRECMSRNETIVPYQLQFNEFAACVKIITNWALYKTDELWNQARKSIVQSEALPDCSGTFRAIHGMPCVHELKAIIESEGRLHLMPSHFDKHWWIQQGPEQEHIAAARILDPLPARAKGCRKPREITHKRNHGANGTARELVHFERVDINDTNLTASQPTQPDPALFGTQTLDKVHESGQQNSAAATVPYHHHHTPARSWGYAGMSPYK